MAAMAGAKVPGMATYWNWDLIADTPDNSATAQRLHAPNSSEGSSMK